MSRSLHTWYSLPDLDVLARRETVLEDAIAFERLPRLAELLHRKAGSINARLAFRRIQDDVLILALECDAELELVCQRCLEPVTLRSSSDVEFVVVDDENPAAVLPEGVERIVLGGDRFNPAELVEDEMIVSLPLVPKHASKDECGRLARKIDELNRESADEHERSGGSLTQY